MFKITFGGAFGIGSQGDDASLVVFANLLRQQIGPFDGVVISRHPQEDDYKRYGLRSIANIEYPTREESLDKWFRGFNPMDDRADLRRLESEIGESDLLVLGAGNAFIDQTIGLLRGPIPYFTLLTLMARMSGVPVMLYGISVGPVDTPYGRKLTRLCADLCEAVTLRDPLSVSRLKEMGWTGPHHLLPDPVIGLTCPDPAVAHGVDAYKRAYSTGDDVAAVSVRALPASVMRHERYVQMMADLCDGLVADHGLHILFVPQCTYTKGDPAQDDRNVAAEVVRAMHQAHAATLVREELDVDQCLALYSSARIAICTRLHGAVFAAINGVPIMALNYNPKVASFMEWLKQPGQVLQPAECIDRWRDLAGQTLANGPALSKGVLARVEQGRPQVHQYIQIALGCLNRPNM